MSTECPCGSRKKYDECCLPSHRGKPAPSAEALMRSRYSAYALVIPEYIIVTTHPANPLYRRDLKAWTEEIRQFGKETEFRGLEIVKIEEKGKTARVTFVARLARKGDDLTFTEKSLFERVGNRWLYRSGEVKPGSPG